jgi:hypothetical protein
MPRLSGTVPNALRCKKNWGCRDAEQRLRLSLIASDEEVSNRLITMSREYLAKSDALAGEADTQPAPADHGSGSPAGDIDPGEAGLGLSPQMQAPRLDR